MGTETSAKQKAWVIFDRIVADAAPGGVYTNPWVKQSGGELQYVPDYGTLTKLLGVPLYLDVDTRTGVPELSLDVWLSYELRRAGFDADATWPRGTHPRILPMPIANLLKAVTAKERAQINARLTRSAAVGGVTSSSANILGKNYLKQVDVIMTDWATGPELLISTKRMDSSYGKNAANRVEESYGDAKNLRLRHPLAALGFVFGLRSDILEKEPDTSEWLIDLLGKLGREDDAYHATCLVMLEYGDSLAPEPDSGEEPEDHLASAGVEAEEEQSAEVPDIPNMEVDRALQDLPSVAIRHDAVPEQLAPSIFLAKMVDRVLDATPVNMHKPARRRRAEAKATNGDATS